MIFIPVITAAVIGAVAITGCHKKREVTQVYDVPPVKTDTYHRDSIVVEREIEVIGKNMQSTLDLLEKRIEETEAPSFLIEDDEGTPKQ